MADLATYQQQANNIYDPQLAADRQQEDVKAASAQGALNLEQGAIEPAYQRAIRSLNDTTTSNEGKLNQLYSQRLGGMFSGLQGNDMGMMYAKAGQAQGDIESQRAGKLADIAQRRTSIQLAHDAGISSLVSKNTGTKNQYAISNYNSAAQAEAANAQAAAQANARDATAIQVARIRAASTTDKTTAKQLPNDIINYFVSAPSQYGNYNRNTSNYHRWQAAEQELKANGIDPYSGAVRQQLIQTFGSPDERATTNSGYVM